MKTCRTCGEAKPLDEFPKSGKWILGRCKACQKRHDVLRKGGEFRRCAWCGKEYAYYLDRSSIYCSTACLKEYERSVEGSAPKRIPCPPGFLLKMMKARTA